MKTLYTDGSTLKNGQPGQQSIIFVCDENGHLLLEENIGDKTINQAEVGAIYRALQMGPAIIISDSKIAVNWVVRGKVGKKAPHCKKIVEACHDLLQRTESSITWVPRELNKAGHYVENSVRKW